MQFPAFRFEAEGFSAGGERILGRQSAGEGFLRAVIAAAGRDTIYGYGPSKTGKDQLGQRIRELAADAPLPALPAHDWIFTGRLDEISRAGGVHFPDPAMGALARARLRCGVASFSLTGVTHTICSKSTMGAIADLAVGPLMPWDALVCTSLAVKLAVLRILEQQQAYISWRFPGAGTPERPQLPVIPLGVHAQDFVFSGDDRRKARGELGIAEEEVVFLFTGRLSFHAKAHPFPMLEALEAVASETGRKITLLQCGWFANKFIEDAFKSSAARFAPSVRHLWQNGTDPRARSNAWAAADVFLSLPDNIQETFGITPVEAMACGLPVIASDWNGYKDTVVEGETGFRIPSFMPQSPTGDDLAHDYAMDVLNYDHYIGHAAMRVSLDLSALRDAARRLAENPDLRREMGEKGRERVRCCYDWAVVFRRYAELWSELRSIRLDAARHRSTAPAPRAFADAMNPFELFSHYPTQLLDGNTLLTRRQSSHDLSTLLADPTFSYAKDRLPKPELLQAILAACAGPGRHTAGDLARSLNLAEHVVIDAASFLAKLGLLEASTAR